MAERQVLDLEGGSGSEGSSEDAEERGKPTHGAGILMLLGRLRKHEARGSPGEASEGKGHFEQADPAVRPCQVTAGDTDRCSSRDGQRGGALLRLGEPSGRSAASDRPYQPQVL